ncbi:YggS family pyridoxal phosphate-dependent enzyme [Desulforegula conservatrix]|uniref:YggS family pyridoxal phosphate-dependent enzyme n=1 Tax=Desulforegula conservatrix TaxID=153026 RepID=UPI00041939A9|nr:YggS family pyridoxal phosphate-dependent enzyme [Desulforegula conservatrix]
MDGLKERIASIKCRIATAAKKAGRNTYDVRLIAVSKKKSAEMVIQAIEAGQTIFGENYIQEAASKIEEVSRPESSWHFIGHLQKNKAKYAVRYFDLIHTVDSEALASELGKNAAKINKIQDILIQVRIGDEDSKSGVEPFKVAELVKNISNIENIRIKGLMTIPPPVENPEEARAFFRKLKNISDEIRANNIPGVLMDELSMGMSDDFEVAISEGATLVRVGTAIFGGRS